MERIVTDDMLNGTGVIGGGLFAYAKLHQNGTDYPVAFVDFFGNILSAFRQGYVTGIINQEIAFTLQKIDCPADRRLVEIHMFRKVDRTDMRFLLMQHQNGFQIHFAGFV